VSKTVIPQKPCCERFKPVVAALAIDRASGMLGILPTGSVIRSR
jgi:hypothetical protein